ncbi:MAG: O-antigen ligase family protein [Promethearchaeota archaeon]
MTWKDRDRLFFSGFTLIYLIALYFFYIKYVPFVKPFQFILIPFLFITFILTVFNIQWGILFFIFSFPLINNLPYFFGIFENTPHAPIALILFLFFFLGWLVRNIIFPSKLSFDYPIFKPMILFSILILTSAIITFFRYANFYPFLSDYIYELITNVNGVTAGGAIMSVVFSSLNYLTGFAFFFIVLNTVKTKEFINKILNILLISAFITVIFGFYQYLTSIEIGNTPFWVKLNRINSTFKDPNSFGIFLSLILPLLLGKIFFNNKGLRVFFIFEIIAILIIFPYIGSRSGFLGLILAFFLFFILVIINQTPKKRLIYFIFFILIIFLFICSFSVIFKYSNLYERLNLSKDVLINKESLNSFFMGRLYFWNEALQMIKNYPLTGVGIGAFIVELPNYFKIHGIPYKYTDSTENYFLQISAEFGLIGLILVLIIFYFIIHEIIVGFRNNSINFKLKYLYFGLIASIASYFINIFFHTYIGNFEVKYTFWLLVALIFSFRKEVEASPKKHFVDNMYRFGGILIIAIFTSIHLWNSTHSLSLSTRTKELNLKQNFGFSKIEKDLSGKTFRWTKKYGGLHFRINKPVIEFSLLASHPDIKKKPVKVKIYLIKKFFKHKRLLDEIILRENKWKRYKYYLPEEVGSKVILLFKISRTWNPFKILGIPDYRDLGIAISEINFREEIGEEGIGFYRDEKEGEYRRTRKKAILEYQVRSKKIIIPILASHPDINKKPVTLKIIIDNKKIKLIKIKDNNWHNYEIKIPEKYIGKKILLGFEVDRTWCPFEYKIANDKRDLGVSIGKIENGN